MHGDDDDDEDDHDDEAPQAKREGLEEAVKGLVPVGRLGLGFRLAPQITNSFVCENR